jgi:hypothetical protein
MCFGLYGAELTSVSLLARANHDEQLLYAQNNPGATLYNIKTSKDFVRSVAYGSKAGMVNLEHS